MNMDKKVQIHLFVLVFSLSAFFTCGWCVGATMATAHADPIDYGQLIRQQDALGQTPGEIAAAIHAGDPRISWAQAANEVWGALRDQP